MDHELSAVAIDADKSCLLLIERMAAEVGFHVTGFSQATDAMAYLQTGIVDIVFVASSVPQRAGMDLIQKIRARHAETPIVFITGVADQEDLKLKALKAGVTEFLNKPLFLSEFTARIGCLAQLRKGQLFYKEWSQLLQREIEKATRKSVEREIDAIHALGRIAEHGDPGVGNHISRVAHFSRMLAKGTGEKEFQQDLIFKSAPLHDVGKLGVPESILLKSGPLTHEEMEKVKAHTTLGFRIMSDSMSPFLQTGSTIALTHHERWDGSGYPKGLRGEDIPLFGRIGAIADVFDALISRRPYREPWSLDRAFEYVDSQKGTQFDPRLAAAFLEDRTGVQEVCDTYRDPEFPEYRPRG
jgi:response regulator RpfG family c-di-GMP phosphodiesterase